MISGGCKARSRPPQSLKISLPKPENWTCRDPPRPVLRVLLELPIDDMKFYRWAKNRYRGQEILVSRTGYTGELGFEIYGSNDLIETFWDDCLVYGVVLVAGLGARDTLRLEMGFPLYGHELDETSNPAETGFTRAIAAGKQFTGSKIIGDPRKKKQSLVGISLAGRRAARHSDTVRDQGDRAIGRVTSGFPFPRRSHAPSHSAMLQGTRRESAWR